MGVWVFSALVFGALAGWVAKVVQANGGAPAMPGLPLVIGLAVAFFILLAGIGAQITQHKD